MFFTCPPVHMSVSVISDYTTLQYHKGMRRQGARKSGGVKADRWVEWGTEQREWRKEAGAACACVCVCLETGIRNSRESAQRGEASPRCQIWTQWKDLTGAKKKKNPVRYRAVEGGSDGTTGWQNREVNRGTITLWVVLVGLVSTVTTWVQWWALWPCKPNRGDHLEVRRC